MVSRHVNQAMLTDNESVSFQVISSRTSQDLVHNQHPSRNASQSTKLASSLIDVHDLLGTLLVLAVPANE